MHVDWTLNVSLVITVAVLGLAGLRAWFVIQQQVLDLNRWRIDHMEEYRKHLEAVTSDRDVIEYRRQQREHALSEILMKIAETQARNVALIETVERRVARVEHRLDSSTPVSH